MKESISERNGINFLSKTDQLIYSVGISTGGQAEMKMAQEDPKRQIVAITIDQEGAEFAKTNPSALKGKYTIDAEGNVCVTP